MTKSTGPNHFGQQSRIAVLTADSSVAEAAQEAFASPSALTDLTVVEGRLAHHVDKLGNATVIVLDIDPSDRAELVALQRLVTRLDGRTPVVVIMPALDQEAVRNFMHMRVADFLIKPVAPQELYRTCVRVLETSVSGDRRDSQIFTFLPAVGGAGVTTVAIQTALLLQEEGGKGSSTCLVDLDFQHGACADYLDLEPRLDLKEIAPRPERLDRQLLEVMISYHKSGIALIAAPNRPAEMRVFDPELVTRLLDLVASHFDYVVIDMPRTWFTWTDSVLLGSDRVYIISEMTVPSVKQARQITAAIRERLEGPRPQVIVNRFEARMFGASLRRADIEQALGEDFAGVLPNDYALVREAIDRGVPLTEVKAKNKVTAQLRKLVVPTADKARAGEGALSRLSLPGSFSWAR